MELLVNSINHLLSSREYEEILHRSLPHQKPKNVKSIYSIYNDQPPKKRTKTSGTIVPHNLTLFRGYIYSAVGSAILDQKQSDVTQRIVSTLSQGINNNNQDYISCIYLAIALFQLTEDSIVINTSDSKRKTSLGYWLDGLLNFFPETHIKRQ